MSDSPIKYCLIKKAETHGSCLGEIITPARYLDTEGLCQLGPATVNPVTRGVEGDGSGIIL